MAKNATVIEDSDVEMDEVPKNNKKAANGGSDEVEGGSAVEEEEYEIEGILGHRYAMKEFGGRIGYLVKWKGFPDSENSYVDEDDALGAQDLIDAYWKGLKKDPKKDPKKGGRKSNVSAREPSEEPAEATPPPQPKKRGRPRKSKTPTPDDSDEEEVVAPKKKAKPAPRKSGGTASKGRKQEKQREEDEDVEDLGTMDRWMDAPSWEHLVDTIDTVERTQEDELLVYFTLNNKSATKAGFTRCRERSDICKKKMPEKLLNFYESNLRWRDEGGEDA